MDWVDRIDAPTVLVLSGSLLLVLTLVRLALKPGTAGVHHLIDNIQALLAIVIAIFLIVRPFIFQVFFIPSPSMVPTLLGGPGMQSDRLIVNKLVYLFSDPKRGEIAVFRAPPHVAPDQKEFIKRVIGVPGDTVQVVPPRLLVDGRVLAALTTVGARHSSIPGLPVDLSRDDGLVIMDGSARVLLHGQSQPLRVLIGPTARVELVGNRVVVNGQALEEAPGGSLSTQPLGAEYGTDPSVEGVVVLRDGLPWAITARGQRLVLEPGEVRVNGRALHEPYVAEAPRYAMAPVKLGPGEYFVMGDNRNESNDSHEWGTLTRDRFVGRAEILFWPPARIRILDWWLIAFGLIALLVYQGAIRLWPRDVRRPAEAAPEGVP